MHLPQFITLAIGATGVLASPANRPPIVHPIPQNDIIIRDLTTSNTLTPSPPSLEKRISDSFPLDKTWQNAVLFNGNLITSPPGSPTKVLSLHVECVECWTKGTVTARLTTEDVFKPVVRFELVGVEAFAMMDVQATGSLVFALNLFTSETPLGIKIPGLELGIIFSVDLVFVLSDSIELEGGFYTKLVDDAFFEIDVFDGEITDRLFNGSGFKTLPVQVTSGPTTFQADLRLRVDCGASAGFESIGLDAGASVGIFANLVEFIATLDSTPSCALEAKEFFDLNIGASASAGVGAGATTLNVVPGVSTTLLESPTSTQCLLPKRAVESNGIYWNGTGVVPTLTQPYGSGSVATSSSIMIPSNSTAQVTPAPATQMAMNEYTITTCNATVINCPASLASIIVITQTAPAASTPEVTQAAQLGIQAINDVVWLSEMASPVVQTFVEDAIVGARQTGA